MQVGAKQVWESPHDYRGILPTTGKGVGIMVLDEGFDVTHPDIADKIATTLATSETDNFEKDEFGHGSHVLGVIGASGASSNGRIQGVAPGAHLIPGKIKLDNLETTAQTFANAVYWATQNKEQFNIRVINCSFVIPLSVAGMGAQSIADPFAYAIDLATRAGIVVVAGTGNFGAKLGVGAPASHPDVIAVGALDTAGTPGDPSDDQVPAFSSRGRNANGEIKPDVIAPGVRIMSLNIADSTMENNNASNLAKSRLALEGTSEQLRDLARGLIESNQMDPRLLKLPDEKLRTSVVRRFDVQPTEGHLNGHAAYIAENGTSMATPWVAALCAHVLEANPDLTPHQVKEIIMNTAQPLPGVEPEAQGHGAVQAQAAVAEALRLKSA